MYTHHKNVEKVIVQMPTCLKMLARLLESQKKLRHTDKETLICVGAHAHTHTCKHKHNGVGGF